ncbi:YojF family protein [Bacillus sp. CLL-7-23]|uniref:YojF family protein n=1 Tax=Bacillus changyiensis TaxID=3004103 RepID=A0ABT4X6A4_9BACI|nr:YojF family protein [Bacillus changyiensis]MDA7027789.1 YojF family protein [Bacillus changyiensis]
MREINKKDVQASLESFLHQPVYIHLETTTGSYSAHKNEQSMTVVAFIRNAKVVCTSAKITGDGPFRAGLKTEDGWIYAEGLTDYTIDHEGRLLLAGHLPEGKLAISFQISKEPFTV